MNTDDLIRLLASDNAAPRPDLRLRLLAAGLAGAALAFAAVAAAGQIRPDIADVAGNWRLAAKFAVALSLAASGAVLSLRLSRPFAATGWTWLILAPGPVILALACAAELAAVAPQDWLRSAAGDHAPACLVAIPLLSALPLAGILMALREGAPASGGQAGIAAGAMAAGIGAAAYALHCPDDSPLFLAVWYVLAALVVLAAGRVGGARLLRW